MPRSYFVGHVVNDPNFQVEGIRVACRGSALLSTARIFFRQLRVGPSSRLVAVGGVGEVATAPAARRSGLAERVGAVITLVQAASMSMSVLGLYCWLLASTAMPSRTHR